MRIICTSLEELLQSLAGDLSRGAVVFQEALFVNIYKKPLDGRTRFDAIKFEVLFDVSVLVAVGSGADEVEFFRDFQEKCGRDYTDGDCETTGTQNAEKLKAQVKEFADANGLRLEPGVLDY